MTERAGFWNFTARRYARTPVADEASYQRKLRETRERLRPDWDLFEFGCGTGTTAIHHAPFVRHIRALDISPRMLEIAREKAAAAGIDNITFEEGGIVAMVAPQARYDAVLGMSILHLLEDPEAVAEKVFAMLKPGGLFFSSTACLDDMHRILRMIVPVGGALRLLPYVKCFSVEDLRGYLTAAGFEIEQLWQPAPGKAVFVIARKPGDGSAGV